MKNKTTTKLTVNSDNIDVTTVVNATTSKHDKQNEKRNLTKQITELNITIFQGVNKDYKELSTQDNFIKATKLQKLNHLKSLYLNKDEIYSLVLTIKEMNLTVPNNLSVGQYKSIIKGVKKGFISKSKIETLTKIKDDNISIKVAITAINKQLKK